MHEVLTMLRSGLERGFHGREKNNALTCCLGSWLVKFESLIIDVCQMVSVTAIVTNTLLRCLCRRHLIGRSLLECPPL